ncbi:hypothetical protein [Streptomyces sp. NPDC048419]|uniref:hypothetical protein n=1 Tax=Streptomyces sp. NPDC048419 TaxID=3365547 RepID=UPI00371B7AF4
MEEIRREDEHDLRALPHLDPQDDAVVGGCLPCSAALSTFVVVLREAVTTSPGQWA